MLKSQVKLLFGVLALVAAVNFTPVQAQEFQNSNDLLNPNGFLVKSELYVWNRFSDILDIVRCGIAFGPGIGAEVAITEYAQLSLYANAETGVAFPHFIPPFWLVDKYENNANAFEFHKGKYATAAFGPWRAETSAESPYVESMHFRRDKWDIRVQLDLLLVHLYVAVRPVEIIDFFTGFVGYDFCLDDLQLNPVIDRRPADQFGRGICNILFGIVEVPNNIFRVTSTEGDLAGASKGVGLGLWRFLVRECVGVVELVTFPFGWEPIIEPAYVINDTDQSTTWKVYKPSFHKRY